MDDDLSCRQRFGRIFAARLAADGLDARDCLWFCPREDALRPRDESVFDLMDLRKAPGAWEAHFADSDGAFPGDFSARVVADLRRRFVLLLVGGLGSHLVPSRIFEELAVHNTPEPWIHHIDYGNTLSSNAQCAERAAAACRAVLARPETAAKQILFWGHSKGANIILELMIRPEYQDLKRRTWGVLSFAGAIGGSPAADTMAARAVQRSGGLPEFVRKAARGAAGRIAKGASHPLVAGLPSLGELPDGVADLSQKQRHAFLNRLEMPDEIRFLSIAAVIKRGRTGRLFSGDFDRRFLRLSAYEVARYGPLNDTQLMLPDAKWPAGPNVRHLATINADHWGLVYRQVLPGARVDPTPRLALAETAMCVIQEME